MKLLIFIPLISFFSLTENSVSNQTSDVYICVSPNAKKYHFSKSCRGLQKCTHTISKVTKSEAVNKGYTVCLIEN